MSDLATMTHGVPTRPDVPEWILHLPNGESAWLTVENMSFRFKLLDGGLFVEAYPLDFEHDDTLIDLGFDLSEIEYERQSYLVGSDYANEHDIQLFPQYHTPEETDNGKETTAG